MKIRTLLFVLSLAFFAGPSFSAQQRSWTGADVADLALYFPNIVTMVAHELGHATAVRLLFKTTIKNLKIYINVSDEQNGYFPLEKPYLIKLGNMFIYSFIPHRWSLYKYTFDDSNEYHSGSFTYKVVMEKIAGPFAGMCAASALTYGFYKCFMWSQKIILKKAKSRKKNLFLHALSCYFCFNLCKSVCSFVRQFIELTPAYGSISDGYCLGRLFGVSEDTLDSLGARLSFLRNF